MPWRSRSSRLRCSFGPSIDEKPTMTDHELLLAIHALLDGQEWTSDTLGEIAALPFERPKYAVVARPLLKTLSREWRRRERSIDEGYQRKAGAGTTATEAD